MDSKSKRSLARQDRRGNKNLEGWFKLIKDNLKIPIIDGTGTIVTDAVITTAFNDGIGKANSDKKAIDES